MASPGPTGYDLYPRQEIYTNLRATGMGKVEAYIQAGYSPKGAASGVANLDRNAAVQERIEQLQLGISRLVMTKAAMDRVWVLQTLRENVERAMERVPVLDKLGNPIGVYTWQGAIANAALQLIGKELGMFRDVVINVDVQAYASGPSELMTEPAPLIPAAQPAMPAPSRVLPASTIR